ncbi:hypothetical protein A2962_03495 [Candidatus Woesebacteria bacterium RIFCSPLOWO2_01_FULL_39_61]|uniref:Response regulatory domain-containing protein n=1 Tax=Candidatus Woesebacteria bacterium RIFCSPHIGHO2_02_FULL_39_13 TaxID=1802505 RepID=A0A1F7Z5T4_9BACT|nr:MAG: hypothetical protein A2692_00625 [Candidatus Woesebacteria bacterium RIFCSPHIGHO2_01_FULL_39_95]OGM34115.1 MAG: hypothetical protein A3D01_00080 [Candidatus Woesebacteria bacterium RIFCSPHIGHO2_02_FULL_39_13]OGM38714.1 MAG: hypothetical protein A3E13_03815 [Candidatus Woesebacteria bacterium RIFCSPHIGHO2_12_FULL_40_20]OGM67575.1 MAG: hypothetical protein A2962_03495 [Candidatus Woesebacteria bacterium RIFCSPLOWO2_01_FULL_39_61]OGM75444.1 MAG: hypothetical protein A3H19_03655 [Candidatus
MDQFKIAVVDDDRLFSDSLRITLQDELGANVVLFTSGEKLLVELNSGKKFDLYILDYHLDRYHRKLWGDEVASLLFEFHPEAKVVGLSTSDEAGRKFRIAGAHFIDTRIGYQDRIKILKQILESN